MRLVNRYTVFGLGSFVLLGSGVVMAQYELTFAANLLVAAVLSAVYAIVGDTQ